MERKTQEQNGTFITFIPDSQMFPKLAFDKEYIEKRLWMYAYLNSGLSLYFNGERFYSKNGLHDLIETEVGDERLYNIIHLREKKNHL